MNNNENELENGNNRQEPRKSADSIWTRILWVGLGEAFIKIGSIIVTILLCGVVIIFAARNYLSEKQPSDPDRVITETQEAPVTDAIVPYYSPSYPMDEKYHLNDGLYRISENHTNLPAKARYQVQKYQVQENDTVIGISEQFNLNPSTILWGNPYTLSDDPHALRAGLEINILPVDGVYYEWHDGDGLNGVSKGGKSQKSG